MTVTHHAAIPRGASGARGYVGRFAPSPTGPLHAGSLVAAVASYLDARAHHGRWLLRIEDIDQPRVRRGATESILDVLHQLQMRPDGEPTFQTAHLPRYAAALDLLRATGHVYPCGCTRAELADSRLNWGSQKSDERGAPPTRSDPAGTQLSSRERIYPGTCRNGLPSGRSARSWRVRVNASPICWQDRNGQSHTDTLAQSVGDFVVHRADGIWAYQLAVVVDDGHQQITDIVRGCDLEGSTARQIHLQRLMGFPEPRYLHVPVVLAADGQKLSKQTGAQPIDLSEPVRALNASLLHLGLAPIEAVSVADFWPRAIERWAQGPWMRDVSNR